MSWSSENGGGGSSSGAPSAFERSLAAVWARMGASDDDVIPNPNNAILAQGSALLGYPCALTAQNFKDPNSPSCGWSCFGDQSGNKQGSMVTFLADAARSGKCQFLDNCLVERILFDGEERAKGTGARPQATGVVARVPRKSVEKARAGNGATTSSSSGIGSSSSSAKEDYVQVHLKAKRAVILSAGSLHSPCVLLRSGLGSVNKHIGKHLRLHPVRTTKNEER